MSGHAQKKQRRRARRLRFWFSLAFYGLLGLLALRAFEILMQGGSLVPTAGVAVAQLAAFGLVLFRISQGVPLRWAFDLFVLNAAVALLTWRVSSHFYWLYALIPVAAAWKLWALIRAASGFLGGGRGDDQALGGNRKERRQAQLRERHA